MRYLTPHSKWSIHSEYQDNLFMLSLSRGGPEIWMSVEDAEPIGVKDNEWIEAYNRNGVCGRSVDRVAPHARGNGLHVPRQGPHGRRSAHRDLGHARRHPQLADPTDDQAHAT